ncbi:hypothetical protein [uncultured Stenotrophomonas sp.]|uniref:hypothetical protein n=1 Tax=uncultured Stenotrophomonas sp. TaxID=165438 RepID=UPI0025D1CFA0|nr:hypothetical protein [uncultured Stenotrophomonas sp.]
MKFDVVQEGSLRRLSHAMDVDDTTREIETRKAKAEAWDEGLELAVATLRAYQDGDQIGDPVTVKDMAGYIPTAINPYRRNHQ